VPPLQRQFTVIDHSAPAAGSRDFSKRPRLVVTSGCIRAAWWRVNRRATPCRRSHTRFAVCGGASREPRDWSEWTRERHPLSRRPAAKHGPSGRTLVIHTRPARV